MPPSGIDSTSRSCSTKRGAAWPKEVEHQLKHDEVRLSYICDGSELPLPLAEVAKARPRTHKSGSIIASQLNVRFDLKATELLRCREMTRRANGRDRLFHLMTLSHEQHRGIAMPGAFAGRPAGNASSVYFPAAIAGGNMGLVLCQVGVHWSGLCPHMLSCPRASNSPRY